MIGDNQFDWTTHDAILQASAARNRHVVLSVFIHWPGETLRIPPHLIDIPFYETSNGYSPNYGEPRLLTALQQFIAAWGRHIDGDTRVAAIHIGLLGFWGEGHTYPDTTLVPETSQELVAGWYRDAFNRTQIQARYPGPNADGFGLFDASLGFSTLDGDANGGVTVDWFMYPQMRQANQENSWTDHIIGGETRPELQSSIFTDTYPARTEHHQDLKECIDTLHISYVLHHGAFQDDGYTGTALERANWIHAYMGYAFYVSEVAAFVGNNASAVDNTIDISVQMVQAGVAPFYYDLSLQLSCAHDSADAGVVEMTVTGVEQLIEQGASARFLFRNVPATTECVEQITLSLQSSYAYPTRPIRLAQGEEDGTNITFSIPLPPVVTDPNESPPAPVSVAPVATASPTVATIMVESPTVIPSTPSTGGSHVMVSTDLIGWIRHSVGRIRQLWNEKIFR